jgi:protein-arginine kinase activator protein McsA
VKAEDYELAAKIRDRIRNGEKVSADGTGDGADAVEH